MRALDDQKAHGRGMYGGGFIINNDAAERLEAATRTPDFIWELSERERAIIKEMNDR